MLSVITPTTEGPLTLYVTRRRGDVGRGSAECRRSTLAFRAAARREASVSHAVSVEPVFLDATVARLLRRGLRFVSIRGKAPWIHVDCCYGNCPARFQLRTRGSPVERVIWTAHVLTVCVCFRKFLLKAVGLVLVNGRGTVLSNVLNTQEACQWSLL